MATTRTANPAQMMGLNKPANGQFKGQPKQGGQQLGPFPPQPGAAQRTSSIPQSSGGIKYVDPVIQDASLVQS